MPAEAALAGPASALLPGFLYTLTRVASAFSLVPIPGFRGAAAAPRVVLILAITLALAPAWINAPPAGEFSLWWLAGEAVLGAVMGATVAWVVETFTLGVQILGLQAGYSYASTIDPTTQADSAVLQIMAQLGAALLFFSAGLDREILRVFAASLERFPPGLWPDGPSWRLSGESAKLWIAWSAAMLATAVRLALPVIAWLAILDVALALAGRLHAQLQLLSLAFPLKMLAALGLLAALSAALATVFEQASGAMVGELWRLIGGRR